MKNIIFLAIIALTVLAGCLQNEPKNSPKEKLEKAIITEASKTLEYHKMHNNYQIICGDDPLTVGYEHKSSNDQTGLKIGIIFKFSYNVELDEKGNPSVVLSPNPGTKLAMEKYKMGKVF